MTIPAGFPTTTFNSPRRRRESSEDRNGYSPSASPESSPSLASLQETTLRESEDQGRYSPGAVVAGRLGALAIRGDCYYRPLNNHTFDNDVNPTAMFHTVQTNCFSNVPTDAHGFIPMPELQPSTAIERHCSSPDRQAPSESATGAHSQRQNTKPSANSPRKLPSSPRKKRKAPPSVKAGSARGTPPLSDETAENLLTWSDSEITGHNPTDPDDDGYGINGIGFKPTAAIAWARAQKRQRQVAEWKSREAREARERRRERRDGTDDLDKLRTIQKGAIQKRVKFDV